MFKIVSVRTASCQVLQLAAFRANVSMSNTREGITLPIPSRREAGREILRETFRLPRSTAARWENKQWTFSGPVLPRSARGGERALFIFSRLRALLGSLRGPTGQCNEKKTGKDTVYRRRYAGPAVIANPRLRREISRRSGKGRSRGRDIKQATRSCFVFHFKFYPSLPGDGSGSLEIQRLLVFEDLHRRNVKKKKIELENCCFLQLFYASNLYARWFFFYYSIEYGLKLLRQQSFEE